VNILARAWQTWLRVGQKIGDFIARIVLSLFYFTVLVPFALIVRLFGDPLDIKPGHSAWVARSTPEPTIEVCRRQF
jgi:hypothetical protein